jgi:hypothetical protein
LGNDDLLHLGPQGLIQRRRILVSAGWALELLGERFDLDDLREGLRPPFDPWVEEYQDGAQTRLLLRSNAWSELTSTGEMMAEAVRLIDHINGVLLVGQSDAQPISHGITLRFLEDGTRVPVLIAGSAQITLGGCRVRGRVVVETPRSFKEPAASVMQERLQKADCQTVISDLLTFIIRADNWFDLFKAMESVERLIGGEAAAQALSSEWKRVRRTANRHRHAPSAKHTLPPKPPTIPEARNVVIGVARQVIDEYASAGSDDHA